MSTLGRRSALVRGSPGARSCGAGTAPPRGWWRLRPLLAARRSQVAALVMVMGVVLDDDRLELHPARSADQWVTVTAVRGRYAPTVAARSPQTQTLEGGVHQRPLEPFATPDVPPLVGDLGLCGGGLADGCIEVVFGALGSDYVLKYQYPTGFDARPDDLWTFENLVNVFQIENRATVTPTPTLDATLGDAGYWTAEEAARMALDMIPYGPWSVTDTRLVSEAEAAGLNLCDMHRDDPDYQWYAYPTGVWIVELTGVFDGRNAVFYTYLDAKTGTHICTAEKGTRP